MQMTFINYTSRNYHFDTEFGCPLPHQHQVFVDVEVLKTIVTTVTTTSATTYIQTQSVTETLTLQSMQTETLSLDTLNHVDGNFAQVQQPTIQRMEINALGIILGFMLFNLLLLIIFGLMCFRKRIAETLNASTLEVTAVTQLNLLLVAQCEALEAYNIQVELRESSASTYSEKKLNKLNKQLKTLQLQIQEMRESEKKKRAEVDLLCIEYVGAKKKVKEDGKIIVILSKENDSLKRVNEKYALDHKAKFQSKKSRNGNQGGMNALIGFKRFCDEKNVLIGNKGEGVGVKRFCDEKNALIANKDQGVGVGEESRDENAVLEVVGSMEGKANDDLKKIQKYEEMLVRYVKLEDLVCLTK